MSDSKIASNFFDAFNGESPKRQEKENDIRVHRNEIVREIVSEFLGNGDNIPSLETLKLLWEINSPPKEVILWLSDIFFEPTGTDYNPSKTGKLPSVRIILATFVSMLFDAVQVPKGGVYPNPTHSTLERVIEMFLTTVRQEKGDILQFPALVIEQVIKRIHTSVVDRISDLTSKSGTTYDFRKLNPKKVKEELQRVNSGINLGKSPYLQKSKSFVERILDSTPLEIEETRSDSTKTFIEDILKTIRPRKNGVYPKLPQRVTEQLKGACLALGKWHCLPIDYVKPGLTSDAVYCTLPGCKMPAHRKNPNDPDFKKKNIVDYANGQYFFAKTVKTDIFGRPGKDKSKKPEVCLLSDKYADMDPYTFEPLKSQNAPFLPNKGDLVCFTVDKQSKHDRNITAGSWFYCSHKLGRMISLLALDKKGNFINQGQDFFTWDDVRSESLGTNGYKKTLIGRGGVKLPKLTEEERKLLYLFLKIEPQSIKYCSSYFSIVELLRFGMLPSRRSCPLGKDGVPSLMEPNIPDLFHRKFLETWTDYDSNKDHEMTWDEIHKGIYPNHPQYLVDEMREKFQKDFEGKMKGYTKKTEVNFENYDFPGLSSSSSTLPPLKKEEETSEENKKRRRRRKGKDEKLPISEEKSSKKREIPSFRDVLERPISEPTPVIPPKMRTTVDEVPYRILKRDDEGKNVDEKKKEKKKQQRCLKSQKFNWNDAELFLLSGGSWADAEKYEQQSKIYVEDYSE